MVKPKSLISYQFEFNTNCSITLIQIPQTSSIHKCSQQIWSCPRHISWQDMLPRLSYSHISHITLYMMIKQSYSSNKNCSNNYSLNPFKCNFGFPGSKSLCLYSDIFSTFFVFIKCTLICQQDLKHLIQCCDLTAIFK